MITNQNRASCTFNCIIYYYKNGMVASRLQRIQTQACIKLSISPPPVGGGNKIKGFGDGEKNQKLKKKKKENF